jgi:hypothetical protein
VQEGLTALANRLAASDLPPADRDAAGTAVGDAIDAAQDIRLLRREPAPDQHARRARTKEMIEQLRAAAHDARALASCCARWPPPGAPTTSTCSL